MVETNGCICNTSKHYNHDAQIIVVINWNSFTYLKLVQDHVRKKCDFLPFPSRSDVISWVVFDGDIDPEWVESLNSVLDDNRLLTMASGERIKFGPNVNFIFETHDLTYASPATVSRMGVIYFRWYLKLFPF